MFFFISPVRGIKFRGAFTPRSVVLFHHTPWCFSTTVGSVVLFHHGRCGAFPPRLPLPVQEFIPEYLAVADWQKAKPSSRNQLRSPSLQTMMVGPEGLHLPAPARVASASSRILMVPEKMEQTESSVADSLVLNERRENLRPRARLDFAWLVGRIAHTVWVSIRRLRHGSAAKLLSGQGATASERGGLDEVGQLATGEKHRPAAPIKIQSFTGVFPDRVRREIDCFFALGESDEIKFVFHERTLRPRRALVKICVPKLSRDSWGWAVLRGVHRGRGGTGLCARLQRHGF